MKFYARNPQTAKLFQFREKDFTLTSHKLIDRMEPRELDLTLARGVPVTQFAEIIAAEKGIPIFRGFVESYEIDSKREKSLTVLGSEAWLNRRSCISYFYPEGTTFSTLFSDTLTDLGQPGLLAVANSSVPPGLDYTVYAAADNQIKIAGGGRLGRFSNRDLFSVDYRYLHQMGEATALADLTPLDNVFYRDSNDIYVKLNNHYQKEWPDLGGLLVENAFDTTVRLGEDSGKSLSGTLQIDQEDEIGDLITDIAIGHGYHVHIRDDWNYTYLDFLEEEGRATGYVFYEKDMESIEKSIPDDPKVHALIGKGLGNQYYTKADLTYTGFWNQEVYEVEHGFKDANGILKSHTDEKYTARQTDWQWKIGLRNKGVLLNPGDFVTIAPNHEPREELSCQTIEYSSGGIMTLELGSKRPTNADSWEILQGLDRGFTDDYLLESTTSWTKTGTFRPSDPAHAFSPDGDDDGDEGYLDFDVPAGSKETALRPRITLSISLSIPGAPDAWKTATAYVTGDFVTNEIDDITCLYECKSNHTSAAASEPGVGASWTTYWTLAGASDLKYGRCAIVVKAGTTSSTFATATACDFGALIGYEIGQTLPEIDITDLITSGAENRVYCYVYLAEEYSATHTSEASHPTINWSATMHFYKRKEMA